MQVILWPMYSGVHKTRIIKENIIHTGCVLQNVRESLQKMLGGVMYDRRNYINTFWILRSRLCWAFDFQLTWTSLWKNSTPTICQIVEEWKQIEHIKQKKNWVHFAYDLRRNKTIFYDKKKNKKKKCLQTMMLTTYFLRKDTLKLTHNNTKWTSTSLKRNIGILSHTPSLLVQLGLVCGCK